MLQVKRNTSAFTLIELLVVVIIVAVLAAVGVPLLSASIVKARTSEADAGIGTIRTGMRARFAEFGTYVGVNGLLPSAANIGLSASDLNGRFFSNGDYAAITAGATTFCAGVTGSGVDGAAPRGSQVAGVVRSIDQNGDIFANVNCTAPRVN